MNIHPLFVHFPVALLSIYSLLEVGSYFSKRLRAQVWLAPVKIFLLLVGFLATLTALVTGSMAEDVLGVGGPRAVIIAVHEPFALATTFIYFLLAGAYTVHIFDQEGWALRIIGKNRLLRRIWHTKKAFARGVLDTGLLPLLALFGFVGITITGALGAAIVYGPNIDPFVSSVYHLFVAR